MQCKQTVRCQPDHDTVEHIFWSRLLEVVHDFLAFLAQFFFGTFTISSMKIFCFYTIVE